MTNRNSQSANLDIIKTEYCALRDEIVKRIDLRQQIISITLTFAAALISAGIVQKEISIFGDSGIPSIAFIYPPIAACLALGWAQHDYRISYIGYYIQTNIESIVPDFKWETNIAEKRPMTRFRLWGFIIQSHGGVFIWTQILAIVIGYSDAAGTVLYWSFLLFDMLILGFVIYIICQLYWDTINLSK